MSAKPKKSDIRKWIKALRSGEYKQTTCVLQDRDGYCCLGVACKVFAPDYALEKRGSDYYLIGSYPKLFLGSPEWLEDIAGKSFDLGCVTRLSDLNDSLNFSFNEIADVLQAVYIEEALL